MRSLVENEHNIPTPFPHNHASNLLLLNNGDLLCVWFGGSREGNADISILCSRFQKENNQWTPPVILSGNPEKSEQNPILFQKPDGEIWLIYTAQNKIYQDSSIVYYRRSLDEGETWGEVKILFETPGSFVRNPPLILENGDIILPAYYSKASSDGFLSEDHSVVKVSSDNGLHWDEYEIPESTGLVHLSIAKSASNQLIGLFRSRKADHIYITRSNDNGRTWTAPVRTNLPNNNSSIQCTRLSSGKLIVLFNNTDAATNPPKENRPPWFKKSDMEAVVSNETESQASIWGVVRSPLSIAASSDDGETWEVTEDIMTVEDSNDFVPEFSYPSVTESMDGTIHIAFTYLRRYIKHLQIQGNIYQ